MRIHLAWGHAGFQQGCITHVDRLGQLRSLAQNRRSQGFCQATYALTGGSDRKGCSRCYWQFRPIEIRLHIN